jgi:hypothetical protein
MSDKQYLESKILTIELIVESMLEELVQSNHIDRDAFDERINKKVEALNKIAKKINELKGDTVNVTLNGFMNNIVIGEA